MSMAIPMARRVSEHHNSVEFPCLYLALAIYAENDRHEDRDTFNGREKVPVLVGHRALGSQVRAGEACALPPLPEG
jgi:hypothetical protein